MDCPIQTSLMVPNALVREGIKRVLADQGFCISQSVATIDQLKFADDGDNHILIYDRLPSAAYEDLSELEKLIAMHPVVRVVLLVDTFDFDLMNRAFSAGVYGYILHDIPVQCFVSMIQLVSLGQKVAPSQLIDMIRRPSQPVANATRGDLAETYHLAEREVEILQCLTRGMPNKTISRTLGLSEATVKLNVKSIFRKMAVSNRTQAALLAREGERLFLPR